MKTSKSYKHLLIERRGPADWIVLNRPDVKNALNLEVAAEFLDAVRVCLSRKEAACLILTGEGGTFSSGGDIKKMSETPQSKNLKGFFLKISKLIHTAVSEIRRSEKPVLAAIPGFVGGVSFGIVLGADLRIAASNAQFCAATIRIGLVANGGATYHLPRMVGLARASEILFLGDLISADQALQMGLINRVVAPENLESETQALAERLAASPSKALGRVKKILNASLTSNLSQQLERERQAIAWSSTTPDFKEGIAAFLEKRKPRFNV